VRQKAIEAGLLTAPAPQPRPLEHVKRIKRKCQNSIDREPAGSHKIIVSLARRPNCEDTDAPGARERELYILPQHGEDRARWLEMHLNV